MGIFDDISRAWKAFTGVNEIESPEPKNVLPFVEPIGFGLDVEPMSAKDRKDPSAVVQNALRAAQETTRAARYTDFDAMDSGDVGQMLDATVDSTVVFEDDPEIRVFKLEADDPNIKDLLEAATKAANIREVAEEILRDGYKYGDGFGEPVFQKKALVGIQTYSPKEIRTARNDKGELLDGTDTDGFPIAFQQLKQGTIVAGWKPYEMLHFKLFPNRKKLYSERGMLDPIRATWRKLEMVEQGMVVARISRAYPRRVHYLDVTGKDRSEQEDFIKRFIYRLTNKSRGVKPTNSDGLPIIDVSEDLYLTTGYIPSPDGKSLQAMLNKTEIEDPATAGLSSLDDVYYLRQKLWSGAPSDLVGIKRNNTTDLDSQDLAYGRFLLRAQRQLEKWLRGVFDQVLLAAGKNPDEVQYSIILPTVNVRGSWKYADARFRESLTLRNYAEMGAISRQWMLARAYNLSEQEIKKIWAQIEEEAQNPIFLPIGQSASNGAPSATGSITGAIQKSSPDGSGGTPVGDKTIPATGADPDSKSTTKNGISRGTDLGQMLRGNNST